MPVFLNSLLCKNSKTTAGEHLNFKMSDNCKTPAKCITVHNKNAWPYISSFDYISQKRFFLKVSTVMYDEYLSIVIKNVDHS